MEAVSPDKRVKTSIYFALSHIPMCSIRLESRRWSISFQNPSSSTFYAHPTMHPRCHRMLSIIIENVKWLPDLFFSSFNMPALWLYVYSGWKENERSSGPVRFPSPLQFFISPAAFIPCKMIRIIYALPDTHFRIWFPGSSGCLAKQPPERPWPPRSLRLPKSIIQWTEVGEKMRTDYGLLRKHMWRLPGEWRSSLVSVRMNLHSCLKAKSISNALQKWPLSSRFMTLKTFIPLGWT